MLLDRCGVKVYKYFDWLWIRSNGEFLWRRLLNLGPKFLIVSEQSLITWWSCSHSLSGRYLAAARMMAWRRRMNLYECDSNLKKRWVTKLQSSVLIQRDGLFETSLSDYQTHVTQCRLFIFMTLDRSLESLISLKSSWISFHVPGIATCRTGGHKVGRLWPGLYALHIVKRKQDKRFPWMKQYRVRCCVILSVKC